eukprot:4244354-Prymnesium_polylepis.1
MVVDEGAEAAAAGADEGAMVVAAAATETAAAVADATAMETEASWASMDAEARGAAGAAVAEAGVTVAMAVDEEATEADAEVEATGSAARAPAGGAQRWQAHAVEVPQDVQALGGAASGEVMRDEVGGGPLLALRRDAGDAAGGRPTTAPTVGTGLAPTGAAEGTVSGRAGSASAGDGSGQPGLQLSSTIDSRPAGAAPPATVPSPFTSEEPRAAAAADD